MSEFHSHTPLPKQDDVTFNRDDASAGTFGPFKGLVTGIRAVLGYLQGLVLTLLIGSLQAYKLLISPLLGSRCRYHPSCSVYAQTSIQRFGAGKGSWLALRRLLRCGPWGAGGVDEVPHAKPHTNHMHTTDCCASPTLQVAVNRTRA